MRLAGSPEPNMPRIARRLTLPRRLVCDSLGKRRDDLEALIDGCQLLRGVDQGGGTVTDAERL